MEIVSAARVVGVRVGVDEGIAVGVRVGVGGKVDVGVADGPVAVGKGCEAVGVRVGEGSGEAPRLTSNERTVDQAPFVPPPVIARTRHQKRRSVVNVCEVWVCVSPRKENSTGALNELESSYWNSYVAAPATALHEKVILWLSGSCAPFAGLSSDGAARGAGVGGAVPPPVVLIGTYKAALAPPTNKATSGLASLLKSLAVMKMPPRLD